MKEFTEKDLVDFGNQLLSKDREVKHEINKYQVTDADVYKFRENVKIPLDLKTDENKKRFLNLEKQIELQYLYIKKLNSSFDLLSYVSLLIFIFSIFCFFYNKK